MKTPGQIAYEAWIAGSLNPKWDMCWCKQTWEAAAQAVLSSQWRSVDDPPEDNTKLALFMCHGMFPTTLPFREGVSAYSHWMPIPAIPTPTDEGKSRSEFEEHWDNLPSSSIDGKSMAFIHWEAGRKSKEEQKP